MYPGASHDDGRNLLPRLGVSYATQLSQYCQKVKLKKMEFFGKTTGIGLKRPKNGDTSLFLFVRAARAALRVACPTTQPQ